MSNLAFAGLKDSSRKLSTEVADVALALGGMGIAVGAIKIYFGKVEGKQDIANTIFGIIAVVASAALIAFFKKTIR